MPYLVCLWRCGGLIAEVSLDSCEAVISSDSIAETEVGAVYRQSAMITRIRNQYMLQAA